jgi:hypothetical protein
MTVRKPSLTESLLGLILLFQIMNHFEIQDLKKAETDTMSQVIMSQQEIQSDRSAFEQLGRPLGPHRMSEHDEDAIREQPSDLQHRHLLFFTQKGRGVDGSVNHGLHQLTLCGDENPDGETEHANEDCGTDPGDLQDSDLASVHNRNKSDNSNNYCQHNRQELDSVSERFSAKCNAVGVLIAMDEPF